MNLNSQKFRRLNIKRLFNRCLPWRSLSMLLIWAAFCCFGGERPNAFSTICFFGCWERDWAFVHSRFLLISRLFMHVKLFVQGYLTLILTRSYKSFQRSHIEGQSSFNLLVIKISFERGKAKRNTYKSSSKTYTHRASSVGLGTISDNNLKAACSNDRLYLCRLQYEWGFLRRLQEEGFFYLLIPQNGNFVWIFVFLSTAASLFCPEKNKNQIVTSASKTKQ